MLARVFQGLSWQENVSVPHVVRDQRDASKGYGLHAGQIVQTPEELLIEVFQALVFVTALLHIQGKKQQTFLIKAELHLLQVVKGAYEQARTDQQQER